MTEGAVAMRSRLNSRSSRSWMISRCSSPRKPQRKPKPSAAEVSISKEKLASLRRSFPIAARKSSNCAASTGNSPQNTTGIAGAELAGFQHLRGEHADAVDLVARMRPHHADALAFFERAVDDAQQHDDA